MRYDGKKEAKAWALQNLKGYVPSLFTPLTDDSEVDEEGLRLLVERCLEVGSDAILWGAADFFTFTLQERKKIAEIVIDATKGQVPVAIMTGSHCAKDCLELTRHAEVTGADIAMIMTPYLYAKTDESVYSFYKFVAEGVNIGISLYNTIPAGYIVSPDLISKLATHIPNICAVRNGHNDFIHTMQTWNLVGRQIIVGESSEEFFIHVLALIKPALLFGNQVPFLYQTPEWKPIREYTDLAFAGRMSEAVVSYYKLDPLRRILSDAFWKSFSKGVEPLSTLKYWAELLGLRCGPVRPPLLPMSEEEKKSLKTALMGTALPISP
jgi:4-hydroxy-tetrahydrodipicolinate synthase